MRELLSKYSKWILGTLAIVFFVLSSGMQNALNVDRAEMGLTRLEPLENAPPILAFTTVALGGFRGLIANALWIRASDLQEEGKYFEMVQLADWITKLQPRITTVWYHLAWNMAYNISVKFQDPQDRWLWVQRGIELLRDQGLVYNPTETLLYRELSWFFQHKMGQDMDDAHWHYKFSWIRDMQAALGPNADSYRDMLNPETEELQAKLKALKAKYRLDPVVMAEIDEEHGPLDWRLPEAHAIYWAFLGRQVASEEQKLTLRRSTYQSMHLAFQRGRLIHNPFDDTYDLGPNLEIIPKVHESYLQMMQEEPGMAQHIGGAHRNMLKDAVYYLFTHAHMSQAQEWFVELKGRYPQAVEPGMTVEQFAVGRVQEVAGDTSRSKTTNILEGILYQHYLYLAMGEDDKATGYHNLALNIHREFQRKTPMAQDRVGLDPFSEIKQTVLNRILQDETGVSPEMIAQLKTVLGLAADLQGPVKIAPREATPESTGNEDAP